MSEIADRLERLGLRIQSFDTGYLYAARGDTPFVGVQSLHGTYYVVPRNDCVRTLHTENEVVDFVRHLVNMADEERAQGYPGRMFGV